MASTSSHNKKSSAVKRILSEARELSQDHSRLFTASPLDDNMFEWHFTLRGPANTEFAHGLYHGRLLLPPEYPMRPPDLMLLTPNGRWELNKRICLTFTGFHEELWQPAWGVRTALLGLQGFMAERAENAVGVGALEYPVEMRTRLATESRRWTCEVCMRSTLEMLPDMEAEVNGLAATETASPASPASTDSPPPQPQPQPQPQPEPEPASIPATPPLPPSTVDTPATRISPTEHKLALIDTCIKALAILIALLVFKRLV